jgi:hypothetical protein
MKHNNQMERRESIGVEGEGFIVIVEVIVVLINGGWRKG